MHCLRDAASFECFINRPVAPALALLLRTRLAELLLDSDNPFEELVNVYVLDPYDTVQTLESEVGLNPLTRPIDICTAHPDWFELTVILGDDGFGLLIYVPTSTKDAALKRRCIELSSPHIEADL